MAKTKTELERERLILSVYDEFIKTHSSIRQLSKKFNISTATVHDYLKRAEKIFYDKRITEILLENKGSVLSNKIKQRVLLSTKLYLKYKNIEKVACELDEEYQTIYRDLNNRLPQIDLELAKKVSIIMNENKLNNLKKAKSVK